MRRLVPLLVASAALLLWWGFVPDHLAGWDPIQFALGLTHFSIPMHQPHPPGYLGPMGLAALLAALGLPADRAVQGASLLAAALAVPALLALGRRLRGPRTGWLAAILLATHPLMAYQAVSGESYPAEVLTACVLVLLGLRVRPGRGVLPFAIVLGLSGGVRQSLPLFLAPFALWRVLAACRGAGAAATARTLGLAVAGGAAGIAAWGVPLAVLAGGPSALASAFGSQFFALFGAAYSPLLGAPAHRVLANLDALWRHLASVAVPGLVVAILLAPFARSTPADGRRTTDDAPPSPAAVHLAWVLPPLAWFVLMFVAKPGHVLILLPPVCLLAAAALDRAFDRLPRALAATLAGATVAGQVALFVAPPAGWSAAISTSSWPSIAWREEVTADSLAAVRDLAAGDPASVMVVARDGDLSWRQAMLYLPDVRAWWLVDAGSTGAGRPGLDACVGLHGEASCLSGAGFWQRSDLPDAVRVPVPGTVRRIAWAVSPADPFAARVAGAAPLAAVRAGPHAALFVTEVPPGPFRLAAGGYLFER